nr:unnamed protein product [Digitaria exilis]
MARGCGDRRRGRERTAVGGSEGGRTEGARDTATRRRLGDARGFRRAARAVAATPPAFSETE